MQVCVLSYRRYDIQLWLASIIENWADNDQCCTSNQIGYRILVANFEYWYQIGSMIEKAADTDT